MLKRVLRIGLYLLIVLAPAALLNVYGPDSDVDFVYRLGKIFALIGLMILALQPVLAARFKWIERPFGLDVIMRHHKRVDVLAMVLVCLHPLLLVLGGAGWDLIVKPDLPWYVWAGKTALVIFLVSLLISLFRSGIRLRFERWRWVHDILAPLLIVLAFVHSAYAGSDIQTTAIHRLWIGLLGSTMLVFLYHRWIRPMRHRRHPYRVIEVVQETTTVWTIKLAPPDGRSLFNYQPGQFQFITFHRAGHLPVEEHHWTISSSPTDKSHVSSTIKALGDFTSTIGETKSGDTASIHAPFGRFSYAFHPNEKAFVCIVGGIGITPIISMLRHMRDVRATFPVLLLYANHSEGDIVFRKELSEIAAGQYPRLHVVHVLDHPDPAWTGEKGTIDREKLERYCGKLLKDRYFYICGPKRMLETEMNLLHALGVQKKKMHYELFSFPT